MSFRAEFTAILEAAAQSNEQFPLALDFVWDNLGYTQKKTAKQFIVTHFVSGDDFVELPEIFLSISCFESFCDTTGKRKAGKTLSSHWGKIKTASRRDVVSTPASKKRLTNEEYENAIMEEKSAVLKHEEQVLKHKLTRATLEYDFRQLKKPKLAEPIVAESIAQSYHCEDLDVGL